VQGRGTVYHGAEHLITDPVEIEKRFTEDS
jgi:hypothetical protein